MFNCVFLFGQLSRSIYSSYRIVSGIINKVVKRRFSNKKCISLFLRCYGGSKFCEH